ncbi:hypothetical protein [Peribacillus frigoritolerans]|uniref:hypothetical protein n=1 Tax=Peribacillus frigoritolerans TaxID=450367 RepID=UPI003D274575
MKQTSLVKEKLPLGSLLALSTISFSVLVTELLPAGVLPEMSADLGASEAQIGSLVSAYAIASQWLLFLVFPSHAEWNVKLCFFLCWLVLLLLTGLPRFHLTTH